LPIISYICREKKSTWGGDWSSEVQRGDCRLEFWSSDKCGIKVDNPAITSKAIVRTPELLSPDY
jgi:hypothetical protein